MGFRQPMLTAELVTAIRTLERKKRFLPTLSAFHTLLAPFKGKGHRNRLYVSLQNTRNPEPARTFQTLKTCKPKKLNPKIATTTG
jgi:hypothetical protein